MKRILACLLLLLLLAAASLGCVRIRLPRVIDLGGEMTSYTVKPDRAERKYRITIEDLLLTGKAEIAITPSDEPRVEVECKKSLLGYGLSVKFDGDSIRIGTDSPHLTFRNGSVKLHIYANYDRIRLAGAYDVHVDGTGMPQIELDISGAVNCRMDGLAADDVSIGLSGAGNILLEGTADELDVNVSGAAKVDAEALTAKEAEVEISGAGSMTLTVTDELDARISGTGSIRYHGDPKNLKTRVSGAGSIKPAE